MLGVRLCDRLLGLLKSLGGITELRCRRSGPSGTRWHLDEVDTARIYTKIRRGKLRAGGERGRVWERSL